MIQGAEGLDVKNLKPVVLCPAQFGTQRDYEDLQKTLLKRGFNLYPAPLSRLDWLKIVPSTLTKEFFTASLRPSKTLGFFYSALDRAFEQVEKDYGVDVEVAVLGHSIGGWVARSYIAEVLGEEKAKKRIRSLVTLGTPHNPPPKDSIVSAVDQTRGLLSYINENFPNGFPLDASAVTCVAGKGTVTPRGLMDVISKVGEKLWDEKQRRSKLLEEIVALASYFPLSGKAFETEGDGLIPVEVAVLAECRSVIIENCNHAAFVPTPGKSLRLPETYEWYGTESAVDQWIQFL
ncbi:hypothetical protein GUITHDRAFT_102401 [Guillardia theta CCMP2712]|uniref:GPI inositol-deacylase n=2 Tax=Guillardia theta TaxID=55529 RepID=L1JTR7_GUITC|nr:hypothetical protein GUITHDRAFT_102401 [Guillardia theta CCMP2712]EKX51792.1 hypothetical protein GUITHDRAFT_102401 [Guillardia theta CCMP2712]|eukprot:XP_005838772.1 hypothetical protein GUITHDRAFT_102401 [Guillardia theta CCMP2712]